MAHESANPALKASSLAVLFLGTLGSIQMSDPIVTTLALVKASKALDFGPSTQALAASISTLALAATVVPAGVVADKIGRRRLLILALLLTAVGDMIVSFAPDSLVFMVGRTMAGVGLGAVFACAFGFVRSLVDDKTLPVALGVFAAMCSVPLFVYMILGSALANWNWRAAFWMISIACVISAALCLTILPNLKPLPPVKREYWGLLALGIGIIGLLTGISSLARSFTFTRTLLPIVVGVVAMAAFAIIENRAQHPTFPIGLFRSPLFLVGALGGFAWNAASAVVTLLSSNLWQYVGEFSPLATSFRQLPMLVASIIAAIAAGRAIAKGRSAVGVLIFGGIAIVVGLALTGVTASSNTGLFFMTGLVVVMAGCGIMTTPQSQMFVQEAPAAFYGPVTSSRTCVGQLAYAIGLAGGAVIASAVTVSSLASQSSLSDAAATNELTAFLTGEPTSVGGIADYYTSGFALAMYAFAAVVGACTIVIMLLGRKASAHRSVRPLTA